MIKRKISVVSFFFFIVFTVKRMMIISNRMRELELTDEDFREVPKNYEISVSIRSWPMEWV